ncbi:MAG: hypothetical protein ABSA34_03615 [Candidatus Goldiibacteriota bacterium]|jgi:23S rRNA-/tRNA-specific pseudouridylate synthase
MKFIGHPCIGDPVYGDAALDKKIFGSKAPERQMLHAAFLSFQAAGGKTRTEIKAPLPEDFLKTIEYMGSLENNHKQ